jgi:3-hydroxyisobutyrate dehydrogenase
MTDRPSSGPPAVAEPENAVAVLGTGIMGSAMARRLAAAGLRTTVGPVAAGDRAARRGGRAGSRLSAGRCRRCPRGDHDAADRRSRGAGDLRDSAAGACAEGAVSGQMGTIGVEAPIGTVGRLAQIRPDVMFVDAPVSGSKGPAEAGHLLVLASGPPAAQAVAGPVFAAIGHKSVWLGAAGQGSRMKLVVNAYMSTLIEGVAEAVKLASRLGIDAAGREQLPWSCRASSGRCDEAPGKPGEGLAGILQAASALGPGTLFV